MEKFVIPRRAFWRDERPELPMIRWTRKGAEIDPALLTPENVNELHNELFGAFTDEGIVGRYRVLEFYRVTASTQSWRFRHTDCLRVCVLGRKVWHTIRPPYLHNVSDTFRAQGEKK